jgi:hypothetical protein
MLMSFFGISLGLNRMNSEEVTESGSLIVLSLKATEPNAELSVVPVI